MKKTLDLQSKIESMVQLILKGINERHPNTLGDLLQSNRFRKDGIFSKSKKSNLSEQSHILTNATTEFELLRASLGIIFQERYGWNDEEIDNMTFPEVLMALEHAMEYDAPSKMSVWNL